MKRKSVTCNNYEVFDDIAGAKRFKFYFDCIDSIIVNVDGQALATSEHSDNKNLSRPIFDFAKREIQYYCDHKRPIPKNIKMTIDNSTQLKTHRDNLKIFLEPRGHIFEIKE